MSQSTKIPTRHRTNSAWAEHLARLMTRRNPTPHSMQLIWKQAGWHHLNPELVNKILNGILKAPTPTVRMALAHALDLPIWEVDPEPQPIHNRIAWHITDYRLRHNLTSEQFAERAGFGTRWKTTYNIENGQSSGDANQQRIFEFLQVRTVGGEIMDWEQYTSLIPIPAHPILIRFKRRPTLEDRWMQLPSPGKATHPVAARPHINVLQGTVVDDPVDTQPTTVPSAPEPGPDVTVPEHVAPVVPPQGPTSPVSAAPEVPAITQQVEGLDTLRAVAAELLREAATTRYHFAGEGIPSVELEDDMRLALGATSLAHDLLDSQITFMPERKEAGYQLLHDIADLIDPTSDSLSAATQIRLYRFLANVGDPGITTSRVAPTLLNGVNMLIRSGLGRRGLL